MGSLLCKYTPYCIPIMQTLKLPHRKSFGYTAMRSLTLFLWLKHTELKWKKHINVSEPHLLWRAVTGFWSCDITVSSPMWRAGLWHWHKWLPFIEVWGKKRNTKSKHSRKAARTNKITHSKGTCNSSAVIIQTGWASCYISRIAAHHSGDVTDEFPYRRFWLQYLKAVFVKDKTDLKFKSSYCRLLKSEKYFYATVTYF